MTVSIASQQQVAAPVAMQDNPPLLAVITRDRAYEAHRLRVAGNDWATVAASLGYATGKTAAMAANAYLQKAAVEQAPDQRKMALQLAVDRLDAVLNAYWERMTNGDYRAALVVLRVRAQQAKIQRLDRIAIEVAQPRTLMISDMEGEYAAQLKAIVEDDQEAIARY